MKRILSLVLAVVLMCLCFTQSTFADDKPTPRSIPVDEIVDADGNDSISTAQEIENDFTVSGTISSASDVEDYYKITPTITGVMNVWLGNIPTNTDLDLYMYYASGSSMSEQYWSRGVNTTTEMVTNIPVVKGQSYYINVYNATPGTYSTQEYLLRARVMPASYAYYSQKTYNYDTTNFDLLYNSSGQYTTTSWKSYVYNLGCTLHSYAMILDNLQAKTITARDDFRTAATTTAYLSPDPVTVMLANAGFPTITYNSSSGKYLANYSAHPAEPNNATLSAAFGYSAKTVPLSNYDDDEKADIIAYYLAKHPEGILVYTGGSAGNNHTVVFTSTTHEMSNSTAIPEASTAPDSVDDDVSIMSYNTNTFALTATASAYDSMFTVYDPAMQVGNVLFGESTAYTGKGGWSTIWKIIFLEKN